MDCILKGTLFFSCSMVDKNRTIICEFCFIVIAIIVECNTILVDAEIIEESQLIWRCISFKIKTVEVLIWRTFAVVLIAEQVVSDEFNPGGLFSLHLLFFDRLPTV